MSEMDRFGYDSVSHPSHQQAITAVWYCRNTKHAHRWERTALLCSQLSRRVLAFSSAKQAWRMTWACLPDLIWFKRIVSAFRAARYAWGTLLRIVPPSVFKGWI